MKEVHDEGIRRGTADCGRRVTLLLLVAAWLSAASSHAQSGPPPVILENTLPGIEQPFDSLIPDHWGRNRAESMIGPWSVSGGVATASGSQPRLVYVTTDKGFPPSAVGSDDAAMPTGDGWVATVMVSYLDSPQTVVNLEGTSHELQLLGPTSTGVADTFWVYLRYVSILATVALPQDTAVRYTVHYKGLNGGNLLDVWIDDNRVVNGYDLDSATPGQPFDLDSVQLAGGGSGSWTMTFDDLLVGLLDTGPEIVSSSAVPITGATAVTFLSELGAVYALESSDSLVSGPWTRSAPLVSGDGGIMRVHDLDGPSQHRVYRVMRLP